MPKFIFESCSLNYIEKGNGELLIILPGNTASSKAHRPQVVVFSEYFFTVSIDYLGVGKSDRVTDIKDNWWKYASGQVRQLISHLGFEKAILAGTSGGAVVAMHLAASYPEMVKALALDSFSLHFTEDMFKKNVLNQRSAPTKEQDNFWRYCHGEDLRQVIAWDTKNIERMVENGGNWLEDTPGKIKCPALLLGSRADSYIPDIENDFKQLSKKITNNKLVFSQTRDHPLIWTNTKFYQNELFKSLGMDILE